MRCCANCLHGVDSYDWYWSDIENNMVWYPGWTCAEDGTIHSDLGKCGLWTPRCRTKMEAAMTDSHAKRIKEML